MSRSRKSTMSSIIPETTHIQVSLCLFFILVILRSDQGHSLTSQFNRRMFLEISPFAIYSPAVASASLVPASRDVEVGGGFDLLSTTKRGLSDLDVIYPESIEGPWICERVVARVEGDKFQAGEAHRCLGGGSSPLQEGAIEKYATRFIRSPVIDISGVVLDRGFEFSSRAMTKDVIWTVEKPNSLELENKLKLIVVKRAVEVPSDKGFGFDELIRVEDGITTRAIQVKRRYRRSFDEQGSRVIEGLEIMKTFRVLDGIAGTEFPTSTVKSQIRLVRPTI